MVECARVCLSAASGWPDRRLTRRLPLETSFSALIITEHRFPSSRSSPHWHLQSFLMPRMFQPVPAPPTTFSTLQLALTSHLHAL